MVVQAELIQFRSAALTRRAFPFRPDLRLVAFSQLQALIHNLVSSNSSPREIKEEE